MDNISKGKLERWNDERGFGFIKPDNENADVFIHISALKNMSRKPRVGDIIWYQLQFGSDGKGKAVNAKIEGVSSVKAKRTYNSRESSNGWPSKVILILVICSVGLVVYKKNHKLVEEISNNDAQSLQSSVHPAAVHNSSYKCDGRTSCSQMFSCEEATFFINNCPNTKMDGNSDGVPCEKQWCSQ